MLKRQILLFSCLLILALPGFAHEIQAVQDHINVTGTGEVDKEPDQATLNISISAQESTLLAAKQVADQRYSTVLEQIKSAGIDDKDIKATRINAQPQYEWGNNKRVYKGERVSRSLQVTINDLDKVSELMQAIVESGVSTIDGINTGFKDPDILEQEALGIAAQDARSKAEFLAKSLGRELGEAYMISEQNFTPAIHQPSVQMARGSAAFESAPAPEEMFGTQTIKATINVSFNLL
ncbi:MAG: SIMPL domain-containing protein [Acidiferrobacterales bacterium]|nr:SIMPL domain-containing protein [Acidiferrobacterales bacterium]